MISMCFIIIIIVCFSSSNNNSNSNNDNNDNSNSNSNIMIISSNILQQGRDLTLVVRHLKPWTTLPGQQSVANQLSRTHTRISISQLLLMILQYTNSNKY